MSTGAVVTRFAPSPSGEVHLGNARTALFNFLLARKYRGRFVLRIEDTDESRSHERFVEAVCADLAWLGLAWDEGPDRGGPGAPYRQSQRAEIYRRYFEQLEHTQAAYPCFCTAVELELARHAQRAAGQAPRYAGTCRALSDAQRGARLAQGRTATLRFRVPEGQRLQFDDLVHGPQSFATDDIGDFIIRREDGNAAFLFSNAIDDALMQVSHVLRGEDHLTNTPRQRLVLQALGLPVPQYGHVSLLIGADGAPLSKRHGASSVRELREAGYSARAICNHLFRLGHSSPDNALLTPEQMAAAFTLEHLQRASAHFEPAQLRHWQSEWVHALSAEEAHAWLAPLLPPAATAAQVAAFIAAVRPNVVLAEDVQQWREVVFGEALTFEEPALCAAREAGTEFFTAAANAVVQAARAGAAAGTDAAAKSDLLAALRLATGRRGAAFFMPLRAALTGRLHGPELAPLLAAMPPERVRARLMHFAHPAA
jgi:glutamyl-tRNA synthetase